jgi:hypothetical protein
MLVTSLPSSLPYYLFVISVVGYFFGRLALVWIAAGATKSKEKIQALSNGKKGSLLKQDELAAEERFELEKRAFFSRVSGSASATHCSALRTSVLTL